MVATAVVLVVLVLVAAYVIQAGRGESKAQVEAENLTQAVAFGLADQVSRATEVAGVILLDMKSRVLAGEEAPLSPEMASLVREIPQLRAVFLLNAAGRVTASTAPSLTGRDFSGRDWYRALATRASPDSLRLLGPQPGRLLEDVTPESGWRRWTIPIAIGITGPDGSPLGTAVGLLNPDYLSSVAARPAEAMAVSIRLYGFDGLLLARSDGLNDGIGTAQPGNWLFRDFLPRRESGSFTGRDSTGRPVTASLAVSRLVPIVIEVAQLREIVQEAARERDRTFFIAGLIVIVIFGTTLVLLLRQGQRLASSEARAREASRVKEDFLAAMSHEIRTPMNGVMGLSRLLLETELGQVQRRYAETLQRSASHLMTVLNDILDYSKLVSGETKCEEVTFSPEVELSSVVEILAPSGKDRAVELFCSIDPAVPAQVVGDPGRFRQVLLNLVGNALKFTERGWVRVDLSAVRSDSEPGSGWRLECSVSDTGIGLDPAKIDTLFERFMQADASISRRYGGTGLGLAICRGLTELMGGGIQAAQRSGGGSVFRFHIRVGDARPPVEDHVPARHEGHALIFGMPAANGDVLPRQLERFGMQSSQLAPTATLAEALRAAQARQERVACVIVDSRAAEDGGLGSAHEIRSWNTETRIILLSSGEGSEAAPPAGLFDAILLRPTTPSRVGEALRYAFRERASWLPLVPVGAATVLSGDALLVEDNEVNQFVVSRMLEKAGIAVSIAKNGKEALARAAERRFDVILMDMQMPEIDGLTATRAIRRSTGPNQATRIIGLTAAAGEIYEQQCREAGMDDYLSKPVDKEALLRALKLARPATSPGDAAA